MYACACLRDEGHNLLAGRSARIPFKSSQTAPKPGTGIQLGARQHRRGNPEPTRIHGTVNLCGIDARNRVYV